MTHPITNQKPWHNSENYKELISSTPKPLSRKAINKISQHLSKFSNRSINQITFELMQMDFGLYDEHNYSKIVLELPKLLSILINREYGVINIDTSDELDIIIYTLANLIVSGDYLRNTTFTVGLGATTYLPSIRIASYLIPILKTLTKLCEEEMCLPKVRIFKASHTGIYANLLDKELTLKASKITLDFLSSFVSKFYPNLRGCIIFEQDEDYKESGIYNEIKSIENLLSLQTPQSEAIASILRMGNKHGGMVGESNALFYAAAHPIFNNSLISLANKNLTTKSANYSCDLVVDFGGRPQEKFNKVSNEIKKLVNVEAYRFTPTINIIMNCGKVPVYYYAKHGDYHIGDNINKFDFDNVDPLTISDYELLFDEITKFDYLQFVSQFQQEYLFNNHKN